MNPLRVYPHHYTHQTSSVSVPSLRVHQGIILAWKLLLNRAKVLTGNLFQDILESIPTSILLRVEAKRRFPLRKKHPALEWWVERDWLYIRLVNTPYPIFHEVLNKFKRYLDCDMEWHPEKKAWRLPQEYMQQVALFAYESFGKKSLLPRQENPMPYQHRLI
jgi:hypothetical protein